MEFHDCAKILRVNEVFEKPTNVTDKQRKQQVAVLVVAQECTVAIAALIAVIFIKLKLTWTIACKSSNISMLTEAEDFNGSLRFGSINNSKSDLSRLF